MFQFRRFPAYCYFIHSTLTRYCRAGFPHSDICGSRDICSSPQLFAACHVLLRLPVPRHPPCALSCLTSRSSFPPPASLPLPRSSVTYLCMRPPRSLARLASGVKSFAIAIVHSFVKIFLVLFSTLEIESITLLAASRSFS